MMKMKIILVRNGWTAAHTLNLGLGDDFSLNLALWQLILNISCLRLLSQEEEEEGKSFFCSFRWKVESCDDVQLRFKMFSATR